MANTYKVLNVESTIDLDAAQRPMRAKVVTFETTQSHLVGEVRVPVDDFTPENVEPLLADAAAKLEAVKAL